MFKTLQNAWKIQEVRKGLIYTFIMLIIIRIGSQLPIPGVVEGYFDNWFKNNSSDAFNFMDAITGGSFANMSIFALSITPYITSSIIMQLLTIAIPKLEEIQRDGEEGRKKITEITRYVTVGLALTESLAMAIGFGRQGLLENYNALNVIVTVVTLTAGSALLMWIGEQITEKGVGNGISIVLLINIVSRVPADVSGLFETFVASKDNIAKAGLAAAIIIAVILVTTVLVIILQDAERRIAVQYSRKVQGRNQVGGQSTHIPLKVNTAGVIPIIFASSLMQLPMVVATLVGWKGGTGVGAHILSALNSSNWCNPENWSYSIGLLVYILLVVGFAYFYTSITFNPIEIADNMKKQGGSLLGVRPGKPTVDYLTSVLNYIIFIGAVGLIIVAVIPIFFNGYFGASVSFGGTSLIIIAGVILETMKQIESKMLVRYYKGFLSN